MKKAYGFIVFIILVVIGVAIYSAYQNVPRIDYVSYHQENRTYFTKRADLYQELKGLYQDFEEEKITKKELQEKVQTLRTNYQEEMAGRTTLKEEYNIQEDMDLEKIKLHRKTNLSNRLKTIYQKEADIELQEKELDQELEELEQSYFQENMKKKDFLKQERDIEKRETLLELEEERLEKDFQKLGISE